MRPTFESLIIATVLGGALLVPSVQGQGSIDFNGVQTSPRSVAGGEALVFHFNGPANAPLAVLVSEASIYLPTIYGTLIADPLNQDAFMFLDGFDPGHPFYGASRIPVTGNPLTLVIVPFGTNGGPYGAHYPIQGLIMDPTNPYGYSLTNAVVLDYVAPPPAVTYLDPNLAAPGAVFTVSGQHFSDTIAGNTVRVNDAVCEVLSASPTQLVCVLPPTATSGVVTVQTDHGTSVLSTDSLESWMVIAPASFFTDQVMPPVLTGAASIMGSLGTGETRDVTVHLEAGDELYAELYPFDPTTFRVTGYANSQTTFFDPFIRVRRFPATPVTVVSDDDSGPNLAAAIGVVGSPTHYVADITEDVIVELDTFGGASSGPYLLVVGARPATQLPVTVQTIFPTDARPGDMVYIYGSGFDPAQPQAHQVLLNNTVIIPAVVAVGHLEFQVPANGRSGVINVVAPAGTTNYTAERVESYLCVHGFVDEYEVEGTIPSIGVGTLFHGTIGVGADVDEVDVDLTLGQTVSIECYALDPDDFRLTTGLFLSSSPLDPELRVVAAGTAGPYLATDQNGGPGLNAMIGDTSPTAAFVAPWTGTFRIRVTSWFSWSTGPYILVVNPWP